MATIFEPWLLYPSLEPSRLAAIGLVIRETRDGAARLHDPEAGDGAWSLGCRVYERTMNMIKRFALNNPWLTILPESQHLRLTFAIGSVPVKIYCGEPSDVPPRSLVKSYAEVHQMHLAFETDGLKPTNLLRFAIEADASGKTASVTLVEVDEFGTPIRLYEIPAPPSKILPMTSKPIVVGPPIIEVIRPTLEGSNIAEGEDKSGTTDS